MFNNNNNNYEITEFPDFDSLYDSLPPITIRQPKGDKYEIVNRLFAEARRNVAELQRMVYEGEFQEWQYGIAYTNAKLAYEESYHKELVAVFKNAPECPDFPPGELRDGYVIVNRALIEFDRQAQLRNAPKAPK